MTPTPPHSTDSEQCVLGCLLLQPALLSEAQSQLRVDDFYLPQHREVFVALLQLGRDSKPIDPITVTDAMKAAGTARHLEGQYLSVLMNAVPTVATFSHHVENVRSKAILRELQRLGATIAGKAGAGAADPEELLEEIGRQVVAITRASDSGLASVSALTDEVMAELERRRKGPGGLSGISWGIRRLDELTGGLRPGQLVVVGARPGLGKTALACNVAVRAAVDGGTALLVSLEMSRLELVERLFAYLSRTDSEDLRRGSFSDWNGIWAAKKKLDESGLYVEDQTFRYAALCALARRWRAKTAQRRGLLVVDYLQLAEAESKGQSRERVVADISRGLKQLAKELGVPVLAVSQLNRESEKEKRPPRLSDLRESGQVEQDSDVIVFPHHPEPGRPEGLVEMILAKNRHGPTGIVEAHWSGRFYAFDDVAWNQPGAYQQETA